MNINDKGLRDCTGCSACGVICPKGAISFSVNVDGFYTPLLDEGKCVQCGLCKKVCYKFCDVPSETDPGRQYHSSEVYAVLNNYVEQMSTVSTIGIATVLSKSNFGKRKIIGAVFSEDKLSVCHKIADKESDIDKMRGSKYLQSRCFDSFKQIVDSDEDFIAFGTPCQIFGLDKVLKILGKREKAVLVDLYCVGVPTYNLWYGYLDFLKRSFNIGPVDDITFRSKIQGWHKFSVEVKSGKVSYRQNLYNDLFFKFFLQKRCQNLSCYDCLFRHQHIPSDIRLGDFWGEKYRAFDDGVGLMVINSQRGKKAWEEISNFFRSEKVDKDEIRRSQKFDRIIIPDEYANILQKLRNKEKLEFI